MKMKEEFTDYLSQIGIRELFYLRLWRSATSWANSSMMK